MISSQPSLEELFDHVWGMLVRGGADGRHPYHFPSFATIHNQRGIEQRTVVLRKADKGKRQLICYSDMRTRKVAGLAENEQAHWLFYNHGSKEQIRARVTTQLHHQDESSNEKWVTIPPKNRGDYLGPVPPGNLTDEHTDNRPVSFKQNPTEENTQSGYKNFALIVSTVYHLDFLKLSRDGHIRAQFNRRDDKWEKSWVAP